MGNCLVAGTEDGGGEVIRVVTPNGGVMEFSTPITAGSIANEFPGHAIYPTHDLFWKQLSLDEDLKPGNSYHLLPLQVVNQGHVRSKSTPNNSFHHHHHYRMSFDYQGMLKRSYTDAFSSSRYSSNDGFWKVKLVISPDQLVEILSQEDQTQELIENMRAVAKCGNGNSSSSSSCVGEGLSSDQWSLSSSSGNGSSKKQESFQL